MIFRTDINKEFFTRERCFITEILNTGDIPNVSLARARVGPGVTTELHRLSVDEVYYILEGIGALEIDCSPAKEMRPGDAAFIKAGSAQRITNISDSELVFLCICVPGFSPGVYMPLE